MPIIAANFTLGAKLPLDDRQVVETIEARNNISNPYEGLIVYVKANKTVYVYKDTTWEELGSTLPEVDEETETLIWK